jgi:hypothetical protein
MPLASFSVEDIQVSWIIELAQAQRIDHGHEIFEPFDALSFALGSLGVRSICAPEEFLGHLSVGHGLKGVKRPSDDLNPLVEVIGQAKARKGLRLRQ